MELRIELAGLPTLLEGPSGLVREPLKAADTWLRIWAAVPVLRVCARGRDHTEVLICSCVVFSLSS